MMFSRIMYQFRINYKYLLSTLLHVSWSRRIVDNISVSKRYGLQLPRLLSVWFRIYAGFVKFYGFYWHTVMGLKNRGL